jgi:AcrR family transcriptional regulator
MALLLHHRQLLAIEQTTQQHDSDAFHAAILSAVAFQRELCHIEQCSMVLSRKRDQYRESLREEILAAARQLFVAKGYEATSIRAIAERVGASPGILYHYFEDKQDIMAHLVRETFQRLTTKLTAIRLDSDAPLARLRRGLRTYIQFGLEHPHHYSLLFMHPHSWQSKDGHDSDKIRDVFMTEGDAALDCLRNMSAECIAKGLLRPEFQDPNELAQVLWPAIHGLVSIQITCVTFPFLESGRLADRLTDILVQGLVKQP